jgi:hypothetical protein
MVKALNIVAGIGMGALSALNFGLYATNTVTSYESQLLRGTAGYVRQYEGQNPKEALDYAQKTLKLTEQFQPEKIGALEKELSEISTQIGETPSPNVYKPVLSSVGEKIEDASNKKTKSTMSVVAGGICALASLIWFINPATWRRDD